MTDHVAIIPISDALILQFLGFSGGQLVRVEKSFEVWQPCITEFVVRHPDLPEVEEGMMLERICPIYRTYYDKDGNIQRIEREKEDYGENTAITAEKEIE